MSEGKAPLHTPDERYIIVRGRLWRATNPHLPENEREQLITVLMNARRAIKTARANCDPGEEAAARRAVDAAKHGLGERGPVWGMTAHRT